MTEQELLDLYEQRFRADPDPWKFETSAYERDKRAATIVACGPVRRARILELGAANGVLAADLCALGDVVVAVEGVAAAAALARERLADEPGAQVVEGLIPVDVPPGPYDLVVASEILYYLDEPSYRATLEALGRWLAPGGRLVAVHWRPTGEERPRSADDVHADLVAHAALSLVEHRHTDDYLLTMLEAR